MYTRPEGSLYDFRAHGAVDGGPSCGAGLSDRFRPEKSAQRASAFVVRDGTDLIRSATEFQTPALRVLPFVLPFMPPFMLQVDCMAVQIDDDLIALRAREHDGGDYFGRPVALSH